MILKGSQRSGGQDLAVHLMRLDDNDHVELHDLRGFASDNLKDAFREAEAVSEGTKCRQYLFSLSLSPPQDAQVPVEDFEAAIGRVEDRLGLQGQPRAVVFHEKEGRRHAHCVWSRIDAETMTARPLPFFKNRLMEMSRTLYLDHGWEMPQGFVDSAKRNPTNFTLAEWQQAKRQGRDPRWDKAVLQDCWKASDGLRSFESALQQHGFFLARGDQRGFVVIDYEGEVHSLPRMLGVKTRDVADRLKHIDSLPSVVDTRRMLGERMVPAIRRHIAESRNQFRNRAEQLSAYRVEMTALHRQARAKLESRQNIEMEQENQERAARLPRGLRGLWSRITGKYQEVKWQNEVEALQTNQRHSQERQKLIDTQLEQRDVLQGLFRELRKRQAHQLLDLRKDVGRYLQLARPGPPGLSREQSLGLRLER